jgi:hypothetical protein
VLDLAGLVLNDVLGAAGFGHLLALRLGGRLGGMDVGCARAFADAVLPTALRV